MPGLTRSTADSVLKEFYLPGIRKLLNNTVFLLSQIETNTEDIEGRRAVLAINTGRNGGIGARAEGEVLPAAGQQGYAEERIWLKYNYGRIQLSGPVMRSMGSDKGSFTRALQSETEGVTRDLRKDVNRQLFGTSDGVIAAALSAAGQVVTLAATTSPTQLRQLTVGMQIDIGTVASPQLRLAGGTITAVNTTAKTITVTGTVGVVAATDRIFRAIGAQSTIPGSREITGLQTQVNNTGVLWNVDPALWPDWTSYVDDAAGTPRASTETMFTKAQQEVNIRSGEELNLWVTDAGVHRNVASLMTSLKRFPVPVELHGGYSALDMSAVGQGNTGGFTVGMVYDADCPSGMAFGITTDKFQWYKASDWEFMDEDGAVLNRVPNQDAYEATLFLYAELATDKRNAHAVIQDLFYNTPTS
jgi:hypothetical protein